MTKYAQGGPVEAGGSGFWLDGCTPRYIAPRATVPMTALADVTDARFTDDQRATLARFEAAPTPPEVCRTCRGRTRETVGMVCQTCGTDYAAVTVEEVARRGCPECESPFHGSPCPRMPR